MLTIIRGINVLMTSFVLATVTIAVELAIFFNS